MTAATGGKPTSRRTAMAKARQSRRPSRLGAAAGAAAKPDFLRAADAGFPGLLARAWHQAAAAPNLPSALNTLLTLGGHVPAEVQLRAVNIASECAIKALWGMSWRQCEQRDGRVDRPAGKPVAADHDLVGVLPVPWSQCAVADYRDALRRATERRTRSIEDCRRWLAAAGPAGRDEMLELLKDAALRTAPFVLYQEDRQYTNFRDRNNLTGKTLWPGHSECALSRLQGMLLERWPDSDAVLVVCLTLLVRSGGYARIEEANGTQVTLDHVAELLERTRLGYNRVPAGSALGPAPSIQAEHLNDLAAALGDRRRQVARSVQLYREIHGPLLHKIERVAGAPAQPAQQREQMLCGRLRARLPIAGDSLDELGAAIAASPAWLAHPQGAFETGLESLVYETVAAATDTFEADFAMSRGMRSLPELTSALREHDWGRITQWELPQFFCCVVPAPGARRYFDDSAARLADVAWSMSARMQYNSWHFIAGNLPKAAEVVARDYFVPPAIPDIAYYSDQHHHGHVAARVRFSIRSPQPVEVLDRTFSGFVDLRLLRCEGTPFGEQDLLAAHRTSAFIARATSLAAAMVAAGDHIEVTSFDSHWHWATIAADQ